MHLTELRCGRCFRKLGVAVIVRLSGRLEFLCTHRSRGEACRTLNVFTGRADGGIDHEYRRIDER